MQDIDDKENKKQPIEMTTDEALDYCFGPDLAEALRHEAKGDSDDSESEG